MSTGSRAFALVARCATKRSRPCCCILAGSGRVPAQPDAQTRYLATDGLSSTFAMGLLLSTGAVRAEQGGS